MHIPLTPSVVGVVASEAALLEIKDLPLSFGEVRVDKIPSKHRNFRALSEHLREVRGRIILTVRHPEEGGLQILTYARRQRLFLELMPLAHILDVEFRSLNALYEVIQEASRKGVDVMASFHDFKKTPSLEELIRLEKRALEHGVAAMKIATFARDEADIRVLLEFLCLPFTVPKSVMAMGPLGKASRILFGKWSIFNYGSIGKAIVKGQWPALQLQQLLFEDLA